METLSSLTPLSTLQLSALAITFALVFGSYTFYLILSLLAPRPRPPLPLEKKYRYIEPDGNTSVYEDLPCWYDRSTWGSGGKNAPPQSQRMEKAEVAMSLVVPAYNEEERLRGMLSEAVEVLENEYGCLQKQQKKNKQPNGQANGHAPAAVKTEPQSWEILVVSDGSKDKTVRVALEYAKTLSMESKGCIRVVEIVRNRGKGGAVTHGMRHVRGRYVVFADADGASRFSDLAKLVQEAEKVQDERERVVVVGSRAWLVGSEAVVKRSFLRNLLMHGFHLLLRLMTPRKTAMIKDTQCGFKLFSRAALPYIIPFMHSEGWIFDVEMLMLAESADIPVAEVPVGWHEVQGSKLNVVKDSLGMAWGLFVLRAAWGLGIYSR